MTDRSPSINYDDIYNQGNGTNMSMNVNLNPSRPSNSGNFLADFKNSLAALENVVGDNEKKSALLKNTQQELLNYLTNLSAILKELSEKLPRFNDKIQQQNDTINKQLETIGRLNDELDEVRQ